VEPRRRRSGILLHPTSLPGRYGIGDLGPEAFRFVDFLAETHQRVWQVLPLGPTGYGDSPYQCFSAFAGNPLLISLDELRREGLLTEEDLGDAPAFPEESVDFGAVIDFKQPRLQKAYERFQATADPSARDAFEAFRREQASWLADYALYATLKEEHEGRAWTTWEPELRDRQPASLERVRKDRAGAIRARELWQHLFARQWGRVHQACRARDIRVMGDIPIFVAHDSADVWAHPELFLLEKDGHPSVVAGVPPDYFSATGQLWGNPLYRWDVMARDGFAWWVERFRHTLRQMDLVRLDHFRGFESYWEIPGGAETAINGRWVKGPGAALFVALRDALGELPIVAENLGVITPEVEALRRQFGFPGMAILQFAWGTDPQGSTFIPHNLTRDVVDYSGTHDNDTTVGWWTAGVGDSTRTAAEVEEEHDYVRRYLRTDGSEIHWDFIRAVLASVADLAVVPLQDVLGLGNEARMNLPGRPGGNWRWRFRDGVLDAEVRRRLAEMTRLHGRAGAPPAAAAQPSAGG
jgi:4-alpha-glucanotransferase